MDKGGGLECVSATFTPQVVMCEASQLLIDNGYEPFSGARISFTPLAQQASITVLKTNNLM